MTAIRRYTVSLRTGSRSRATDTIGPPIERTDHPIGLGPEVVLPVSHRGGSSSYTATTAQGCAITSLEVA
jgi:hypothetical protein